MRYASLLGELEQHCDALRAAAVAAGPEAHVPTCPRWTVQRLLGHVGRVYSWVVGAIADPSGEDVKPASPPETWDALLPWWDAQHDALIEAFGTDPASPAWLPFPGYERCVASWARRMAHETAIHRLDAEHAASARSATFDPEFAADGVDELLAMLLPGRGDWTETTASGSVLVHATDVGKAWLVKLSQGQPPRVEPVGPLHAEPHADVTVAGDAAAVYRTVWRRPSDATLTGDTALLEPLAAP